MNWRLTSHSSILGRLHERILQNNSKKYAQVGVILDNLIMNTITTTFQVYYSFLLHMIDKDFNVYEGLFFLLKKIKRKRKIFWIDTDQYDGS